MNDSEFLEYDNIDLSVLNKSIENTQLPNLDDNTRNEIVNFITSNKFRNRLYADYTRKERVVNRIIIQKELATGLLKLIDAKLKS